MIEINLTAEYKNLAVAGSPSESILLQNQSSSAIHIIIGNTQPSIEDACYVLFRGQSIVLDNTAGNVWVRGMPGELIFVASSEVISALGIPHLVTLPNDLYTSDSEGFRRIRVDPGQTGFFAGREFRTFFEFSIPSGQVQTIKFTSPTNFIIWEQGLSVDSGSIRMEPFINATDVATFSLSLPAIGKNRMTSRQTPYYTAQMDVKTHPSPVTNGNSISGGTLVDVDRVVASSATAQSQSVSGGAQSERGLPPGTYHIRLQNFGNGTATGVYTVIWEERP